MNFFLKTFIILLVACSASASINDKVEQLLDLQNTDHFKIERSRKSCSYEPSFDYFVQIGMENTFRDDRTFFSDQRFSHRVVIDNVADNIEPISFHFSDFFDESSLVEISETKKILEHYRK